MVDGTDLDVVVERVDLVAGKATHREEAGAPGESPAVTPTAPCATSVVVRRPRSSMACLSITSTVAGVWRAVSPSREPTSATTLVLSGVWATSPPPSKPARRGTAVCVRARPATRAAVLLRCVPGLGSTYRLALRRRDDDRPETVGSFLRLRRALRHAPATMAPEARKARRPSGATDERNQRLIATATA